MSREWSLMHPKDIAQARADIEARQRERARSTAMCKPNRVYDALNHDTGFDHAREPQAQLIVWDERLRRYRRAVFNDPAPKTAPKGKLHSQTRRPQAGNFQRGGSL